MLCENTYPQEYIAECRSKVADQIAAYAALARASGSQPAAEAFEALFFNNMLLILDYLFVHRSRTLEGKNGNPVNEVRILCHALTQNGGKMGVDKAIKFNPAASVLKYQVGDQIKLREADFLRLAEAYFAEIERIYLPVAV